MSLYIHKKESNQDLSAIAKALQDFRGKLDELQNCFQESTDVQVWHIPPKYHFALEDRSFQEELKKMEDALAYAIELECLPLEIPIIQAEIAKWKGDFNGFEKAYQTLEKIGYLEKCKNLKVGPLDKLKSGALTPVDLSFVPENIDGNTDEMKLADLKKAIMDAKTEMKVASSAEDMAAVKVARAKAKELKKEMKALEKNRR